MPNSLEVLVRICIAAILAGLVGLEESETSCRLSNSYISGMLIFGSDEIFMHSNC